MSTRKRARRDCLAVTYRSPLPPEMARVRAVFAPGEAPGVMAQCPLPHASSGSFVRHRCRTKRPKLAIFLRPKSLSANGLRRRRTISARQTVRHRVRNVFGCPRRNSQSRKGLRTPDRRASKICEGDAPRGVRFSPGNALPAFGARHFRFSCPPFICRSSSGVGVNSCPIVFGCLSPAMDRIPTSFVATVPVYSRGP